MEPSSQQLLKFLAEKLGRSLPSNLKNTTANDALAQHWLSESGRRDELWKEWQQYCERFQLGNMELLVSKLDEWREFHNLKKLPVAAIREAVFSVGGRQPEEDGPKFYHRVLAEIAVTRPDLLKQGAVHRSNLPKQGSARNRVSQSRSSSGCALILLVALIPCVYFLLKYG